MARKCHRQESGTVLFSSVSSSGGGLPGRPGLERVRGALYFLGTFPPANRSRDSGAIAVVSLQGFKRVVQFVEMVKLTVILA